MGKRARGQPILNALVLADNVYRDEHSGKCVIAGTFNQISFAKFPGVHPSTSIYINLSDFSGTHSMAMRIVRLSDGRMLGQSEPRDIVQKDRLGHAEINLRLPQLRFEQPGMHVLELLWNDHLLGSCKINVVQLGQQE